LSGLATAIRRHIADNPPPPAWSLIVTVFGDMALPRGGLLSTEGIIGILGLAGVAPPAVRTALSRLVADGWLEGSREGRRSSYRMTARAEQETIAASRRIYNAPPTEFDGRFEIALLVGGTGAERQALRADLVAAGFGALQPDSLIRPVVTGRPPPSRRPGVAVLTEAIPAAEDVPALVAGAYDLASLATRHREFAAVHRGLIATADSAADPTTALIARLLLIHGWRRLVLRDPGLPLPLLAPELRRNPMAAAVGRAYRALYQPSEEGLDALTGRVAERSLDLGRFRDM
jgi:phenylacetic acid degradation operon negative regulatory protein